jgi:RNA recognition motif-containing protein
MRREHIAPSETLFVVNFHEDTTKREDLQMLFEPFGKLLRIDMKRNYAFVQFETVEQATAAKEATDGGKLDQSKITVEYVARKMDNRPRGDSYRGGPPPSRDDYGNSRGGGRYSDSRGGGDRYPMDRGGDRYGGGGGRGRGGDRPYTSEHRDRDRSPPHYSRGGRDHSPPSTRDRYYDDRSRGRSPDRGRYGGDRYGSPDRAHPRGRGGGSSDRYDSYEGSRRDASSRGRDKSRSRSPTEYRSSASRRSPPRGRDYDYEYGRRESRGRSPDYAHRRDVYREDRGYSRD